MSEIWNGEPELTSKGVCKNIDGTGCGVDFGQVSHLWLPEGQSQSPHCLSSEGAQFSP